MRALNPYAALEVHFPVRNKAWVLASRVFDYRSAQVSVALDSRGGPWYSRRAEHISGPLEIEYPTLNSIPEQVDMRIRLSRWPPHATTTWLGADVYQKISFRSVTGAPCEWKEVECDHGVFTDELKQSFHRYFTPGEKVAMPACPSRPEANLAPPKTSTGAQSEPPSRSSDCASQRSREDTENVGEDWDEGTSDWNNWEESEWQRRPNSWWSRPGNWTPNDTPPETTESATEESSPPEVTETMTDTADEHTTAVIPPIAVNRPEEEGETIDDAPPSVTATAEESLPPAPRTPPPSLPRELIKVAAQQQETSSPPAYTAQESMKTIRTRSVTPTGRGPIVADDSFTHSVALQKLAMHRAPLTRGDRLARQMLAIQLQLPPKMYNYLVFGETDAAAIGPIPIADSPQPPHPPFYRSGILDLGGGAE